LKDKFYVVKKIGHTSPFGGGPRGRSFSQKPKNKASNLRLLSFPEIG
jgi:hypothetical protein